LRLKKVATIFFYSKTRIERHQPSKENSNSTSKQ